MGGEAEEDEICVGGDDLERCAAEFQAGAVDTEVGEKWRAGGAGGAEGHRDWQAAARDALGGGVVGEVSDVRM